MKDLFLKKPSVIIIALTVVFVSWVNFNHAKWNLRSVVEWDIVSYYAYLPATFIEKDVKLSFIGDRWEEFRLKKMYVPHKAPNGNYVIKTTMGMAVLYAPFFFLGHLTAHLGGYETNGFSEPYQFFLQFSALFYLVIGLFFLRKVLSPYYNEKVIAMTFLSVVFGTNLFYYASMNGPMPHAYVFALTCMFVYYTLEWHRHPTFKNSLMIGLISGMMILIRPVNAIVLLFFVLVNIENLNTLKEKLLLYKKHLLFLLLILIAAFLCVVPQLLYWKYVTGRYVFFSYIGERFYFADPHLIDGLFGFRKGWLLYTPIMIFSIIGLRYLYRQQKQFFTSVTFIFVVFTYVVLSWWCWWYGGTFSQRGMIDIYPLLSLPFAAYVFHLFEAAQLKKKLGLSVLGLLIAFNLFQTLQYQWGVIHYDSMTKEAYFDSFFRLSRSENFDKLIKAPDYEKARVEGKE